MNHDLRQSIEQELTGNILPFWVDHTPDPIHGGFYGALSNDLKVDDHSPRSAVLYGRILWTFALAYRKYRLPEYLSTAQRAYDYLRQYFWDAKYEGVYWTVNARGEPVETRKHTYAQAFSIYGLSEYYSAAGETGALDLARRIFELAGGQCPRARPWRVYRKPRPRLELRFGSTPQRPRAGLRQIHEYASASAGSLWQPAARVG